MSRDELKAKTLRGMSKRCVTSRHVQLFHWHSPRIYRDGSRAAAAKGARRKADLKGRR
jgi:hypothetical protein